MSMSCNKLYHAFSLANTFNERMDSEVSLSLSLCSMVQMLFGAKSAKKDRAPTNLFFFLFAVVWALYKAPRLSCALKWDKKRGGGSRAADGC